MTTVRLALMGGTLSWQQYKNAVLVLPDPDAWGMPNMHVAVPSNNTVWLNADIEEGYPSIRHMFLIFTIQKEAGKSFWQLGYDDVQVQTI